MSKASAVHNSFDFLKRLKLKAPLATTRVIRRMRGGSQSRLIECEDSELYVVKLADNPQGPNLLANEMLGTILASRIGLPVATAAPIYISAEFLEKNASSLAFDTHQGDRLTQPGLHFGSKLVSGPGQIVSEYVPFGIPLVTAGRSIAIGVFLLDILTCHRDRRQAIFTAKPPSTKQAATFIDHGGMFGGPHWSFNEPLLEYRPLSSIDFSLSDVRLGRQWMKRLLEALPLTLKESLPLIPKTWFCDDPCRLEVILLDRLRRLPELLDSYQHPQRVSPVGEFIWNSRSTFLRNLMLSPRG